MAAGRQGGRVWSPGSLPATRSPQAGRSLATATSGPAPQDRRPGPTRNPTAALGRAHLGGGKAGSGRRRHPPTAPGSLGKEKAQGARGVQSAGCWLRGRRSPAEGSALRPGPVLGRAGSARLLPPVPVHTRAVSHLGRVLSGAVQRWRRRHRPGRAPTVLSRRARVTCLYGPPGGPAPDTPRTRPLALPLSKASGQSSRASPPTAPRRRSLPLDQSATRTRAGRSECK